MEYHACDLADAPCSAGIYAIVNTATGKWYVGQAQNFRTRWRSHHNDLVNRRHHSHYLQRSWDIHGEDAFVFRVLEDVLDLSQLTAREQYWMDSRPRNERYNGSPTASTNRGMKFGSLSIIHKLQISQAHKGRNKGKPLRGITAESIRKRSATHRGKKRSRAFCERNRERLMGHPVSEATREKLRVAQLGKTLSDEHKQRLSESLRGRIFSSDHRAKLQAAADRRKATGEFNDLAIVARMNTPEATAKRNAAIKGKKRTPEQRERMRQARLRYLAQQSASAPSEGTTHL